MRAQDRPLRVLLVNRWYPPHTGFGGVAMYQSFLARGLARAGHQVVVLAARWKASDPAEYEEDGVRIFRVLARHFPLLHQAPLLGRYMRAFFQCLYSARVARKISLLERQFAPDIVEFADVEAEGWWYLRRGSRLPVVVRCHTPTFVLSRYYSNAEVPYDTSWTARMEKSCIGRADGLTAPSRDMAETIRRDCPGLSADIEVIPNCLDAEAFSLKPRSGERQEEPLILHVGRLDRLKGIEILAQAVPVVLKACPRARFVFLGADRADGSGSTWRKRLETLFQEAGLQGSVSFQGEVGKAELLEWYQKADIAVIPSILYESFSYTCAQAMAAGLPSVASRIGGIPETLEAGKEGLIVAPGSASELAAALIHLVKDPGARLRMGKAAREAARARFDTKAVAGRMALFYREVISRCRS